RILTLAVGAALLTAGTAHADLSAQKKHGKPRAKEQAQRVDPGELREHVPAAPIEQTATMGAVSVSAVRMPMQAIKRCYQQELTRAHPDLAGKLVVKIVIKDGKVDKVEVTESNLEDPALEACVLEAVKGWSFPDTSTITITYPFVFSPG